MQVPLPPRALRGAIIATVLLSGTAIGDDLEDGVPLGMISFFVGAEPTCPKGWSRSMETSGRLFIPVNATAEVGVAIGNPLQAEEDRTHSHTYTAQVNLPFKSISAADGGNGEGAKAVPYVFAGETQKIPSGLPFVQLTTCAKP